MSAWFPSGLPEPCHASGLPEPALAGAAVVATVPSASLRVLAGGACDPEVDVNCNEDSLDTPGENEVGAAAIA